MSKLLFLGDFFFDFEYIQDDIEKIAEWIQKNEYAVILNLEGPLSNNGTKKKKRGPNLLQSPLTIDVLKMLNVVGVCLANNHIMDFGEGGLKETIDILNDNHILHTGAGVNIYEALKPMVIVLNGQKIIIQNYGWKVEETVYATNTKAGCAPRDEKLIISQTRKNKEMQEGIQVIIVHWGFEYNLYPMPWDIDLAHKMIDAGCDLIIGHHPHNIQPKEIYKDKSIYYSLGNFYFASKRDGFNKVFSSKIKNMCDYGAMISYDNFTGKTEEYIIYYNKKDKKSIIYEKTLNLIEDISEMNYLDESYEKKVKDNTVNINPVLTVNNKENLVKLRKLQFEYIIAALFRFIRKVHLFEKFYQKLKNMYFNIKKCR